jgi:hypothetical protein
MELGAGGVVSGGVGRAECETRRARDLGPGLRVEVGIATFDIHARSVEADDGELVRTVDACREDSGRVTFQ